MLSKNMKSELFTTKEGVRQGRGLSSLLFIIIIDEIIKAVKQQAKPLYVGHHNLENVNITEYVFADNVAIITSSETNLQYNLNKWNEVLTLNGRTMNKNKTKVMLISREQRNLHIKVDDTDIEY